MHQATSMFNKPLFSLLAASVALASQAAFADIQLGVGDSIVLNGNRISCGPSAGGGPTVTVQSAVDMGEGWRSAGYTTTQVCRNLAQNLSRMTGPAVTARFTCINLVSDESRARLEAQISGPRGYTVAANPVMFQFSDLRFCNEVLGLLGQLSNARLALSGVCQPGQPGYMSQLNASITIR